MIETTLHRPDDGLQGFLPTVPSETSAYASVARLDALLNDQILAADTAGEREEARRWWTVKVHTKRELEAVPPVELAACAERLLCSLQTPEAA